MLRVSYIKGSYRSYINFSGWLVPIHTGMEEQWLAVLPHSKKILG